jgi:acyl-CoA synthetase (AMP-forming)/AMP-acid ligase II
MSIELYINLLALLYLGAVAVVIDQIDDRKKTSMYLKQADCKAAIFSKKAWLLWLIDPAIRNIPVKISGRNVKTNKSVKINELKADNPALITFTTGSSGDPKAAVRSHGFLFRQYETLKQVIKPYPGEIDFVSLPVVLLINLGVGAVSLIPKKTINKLSSKDFQSLSEIIVNNNVERITASPFFLKELSMYHEKTGSTFKLKRIFTGGGPVFPDEAKKINEYLSPDNLTVIYGSTEAEPISIIKGDKLSNSDIIDGLCVGVIHEKVAVKIIQITDQPLISYVELPFEQIGEIIVSGPHVLDSYYKSHDAIKENKIREGEKLWHRTGDAGFIGNDGQLYLTGRAAQMMFFGEKILSPFLLENRLRLIAGISKGTIMINKKNRLVLFLEISKNANKHTIENDIQKLQLPDYDLTYVKKIPLDRRHRTKIDYNSLIN